MKAATETKLKRDTHMAATKTATISLGSYTKQVTKASTDKEAVVAYCMKIAAERRLMIVVKRLYDGRWQGFCSRRNPSGARGWAAGEYELTNAGRRARRLDNHVEGGRVYVADTAAASGPIKVSVAL